LELLSVDGYTIHNGMLRKLANITRIEKLRRMRWAGHEARMEEIRSAHRHLVGKPKEKRPFGRPRRSWEDNITTDLKETGFDVMARIHLSPDYFLRRALLNKKFNLRVI
jgi:hypothetical protein